MSDRIAPTPPAPYLAGGRGFRGVSTNEIQAAAAVRTLIAYAVEDSEKARALGVFAEMIEGGIIPSEIVDGWLSQAADPLESAADVLADSAVDEERDDPKMAASLRETADMCERAAEVLR